MWFSSDPPTIQRRTTRRPPKGERLPGLKLVLRVMMAGAPPSLRTTRLPLRRPLALHSDVHAGRARRRTSQANPARRAIKHAIYTPEGAEVDVAGGGGLP